MRKKQLASKTLLTLCIVIFAVIFMMPFLWMLSSSLKTPMQVFETTFRWITDRLHWENFAEVWNNPDMPFWHLYLNSLFIASVSVVGQIIVASLAAYAFAKIEFPGRDVVFMIMLITMMIPVQALIIPRYMLFYNLKLYDTPWAIILPNLFHATSIFLLRQFYMGIPNELVDAALIDGAGHFRIWTSIMVPLSKNGIISAAILAFISAWNEYLSPLVFLPSRENYTVALGIRWYLNDTAQEYNLMMCAAACTILPIIIIYVSAQKYFEDGVAASGVKG